MSLLNQNFLEYMREGKVVLFLGAGASHGASSSIGEEIPKGEALGKKIAAQFLDGKSTGRSFSTICDFACQKKSVREVQAFIHNELVKYRPAEYHKLIPQFFWSGIVTTNYDLVIERAFEAVPNSMQQLQPYRSDSDIPDGGFPADVLQYVKLHGCITQFERTAPPLIASTDQIIDHREGRAAQFSQFLEWAQTRAMVFVGYGAEDPNLRALMREIAREGENHPYHYLVRPSFEEVEAEYWEARRFRCIPATFEDFLRAIDQAIPRATRALSAAAASTIATTPFARFISVAGRAESPFLTRYLSTMCEHVYNETASPADTPKRFYSGFDLAWYPIEANLDVDRHVGRSILLEQLLLASDQSPARLVALKGHAGSGKSVTLRRLAWVAGKEHGKLAFFVNRTGRIEIAAFDEIFSLTNKAVFLFVDNAVHCADDLYRLHQLARSKKWPLITVCAERINEWNAGCERLETELDRSYELRYLTKAEIDDLLAKLEQHGSLGLLASIPKNERHAELSERLGRQLLVALHEATKNANFQDIVAGEYRNIPSATARLLYLDICALNRFGTPVRAGLISRVHGISFQDFKDEFLSKLEAVVALHVDARTGDYVYTARHPVIAELVYSSSLVSMAERFDNLVRIVARLNPTYSYDTEALNQLTRGGLLAETFPDQSMGRAIYTKVQECFGESLVLFHQWGLYEMHTSGDANGLERARKLFDRALAIQPNRAVEHSLAELALKHSRIARTDVERESWRNEAARIAQKLTGSGSSAFPYHTLVKVANDSVRDALQKLSGHETELTEMAADVAIKEAEDLIRRAHQRFPNEERLLGAEAELSQLLNNAPRALVALKRAFKTNPQSELIARRLARVYRANHDLPSAINTLRVALQHNSGKQTLHFDMATCLREASPDADQTDSDTILYHYARAFGPNDKNHEAQFWCARQYWIAERYDEAKRLFSSLKSVRLAYGQKTRPRGPVLDNSGRAHRFSGQIATLNGSFGYVRLDTRKSEIFFGVSDEQAALEWLHRGARMTFSVAFSLFGPQALDWQKE